MFIIRIISKKQYINHKSGNPGKSWLMFLIRLLSSPIFITFSYKTVLFFINPTTYFIPYYNYLYLFVKRVIF